MFSEYLKTNFPVPILFFENAIRKSRMANSYLLISRLEEDSERFATELSKILNCQKNKFSNPCNECLNCKWISKNEHPHAFLKVFPDEESKKGQIKVEEVRALINELSKTTDCYRVVYFPSSDMNTLTSECCNLMLKTVEEPPENIIFIFANKSKNNILPTILSRSQIIYLNKELDKLISANNITSIEKIKDVFPKNILEAFSKTKQIQEYMDENTVNLNDTLALIATSNYEDYKYANPKKYLYLYSKLIHAQKKSKAFMQPRIILDDLCLELNDYVLPDTINSQ